MHLNNKVKYYFISKFDKDNIKKQDKQTVLIYRNYSSNIINQATVLKIKKYCNLRNLRFYLSNNVKLAIKLGLDGAYIPSFNNNFNHLNYTLKKKFILIGSAHNVKEIKIKERQKVQKIFISSLFKKNKNYLGINKFKNISSQTNRTVVALGGISKKNLKKLKLINSIEFAGISYFE